MPKLIDLTGQEFQGCKVIKRVGSDKSGQALWECICKCGRTVVKRRDNLKGGLTKCDVCSKRGKPRVYHIQ